MMMFSRTVSSMSSVSCCGTTPSLARMSAPSAIGSSPRMLSVPPEGGETQPIIRIVEVLPAPFGPRKPNASPRSTSKSTPSTATSSPNRFMSPRACTSGGCAPASTTPSTYPRLPAGLETLSREHGRLPWRRLVEPALRLARDGVDFPSAHAACLAMLAPVMTMNEGAAIYAPGGTLLQGGDRLEQLGLLAAFEALADDA